MIPEVTVCSKPNGEPMAMTMSPTRALPLLPLGSGRYADDFTWITATSVLGSVPTTVASITSPS